MELIAYFLILIFVSVGSFWVAGILYGLARRPAVYFPVSLAAKMAACAVFGSLMFMVGGVILSTVVFNAEMAKRDDYTKWPTIISGALISILCTVAIYFSAMLLAWQILE